MPITKTKIIKFYLSQPDKGPFGALESLGRSLRLRPFGQPFFFGELSLLAPAPPVVIMQVL